MLLKPLSSFTCNTRVSCETQSVFTNSFFSSVFTFITSQSLPPSSSIDRRRHLIEHLYMNMRGLFKIATAASALLSTALAAPITKVRPGNGTDIIITSQNTVNATEPAPANATRPAPANATVASSTFKIAEDIAVSNGRLPLALVNNFAGAINAYVTGLDSNNQLVMLQPDGTWLYPVCDPSISTPQPVNANVAIPLGGQGSTT